MNHGSACSQTAYHALMMFISKARSFLIIILVFNGEKRERRRKNLSQTTSLEQQLMLHTYISKKKEWRAGEKKSKSKYSKNRNLFVFYVAPNDFQETDQRSKDIVGIGVANINVSICCLVRRSICERTTVPISCFVSQHQSYSLWLSCSMLVLSFPPL